MCISVWVCEHVSAYGVQKVFNPLVLELEVVSCQM